MGWINDIVKNVSKGGKDVKEKVKKFSYLKNAKSIKQLAKKNTIVFPVLATDGVSPDTMVVLLKALEKTYIGFLQTVLAQNNFVTVKDGNRGLVGLLGESAVDVSFFEKNWSSIHDAATKSINEDYNLNILNNMSMSRTILKEASTEEEKQAELNTLGDEIVRVARTISRLKDDIKGLTEILNDDPRRSDINYYEVNRQLDVTTQDLATNNRIYDNLIIKDSNLRSTHITPTALDAPRTSARAVSILDGEMKKYSAMQPTVLDVTVQYAAEDGVPAYSGQQAVAVKMNPHFTSSDEMLYRLRDSIKSSHVGFNFIRWTTGELELFKDLIMGLKQARKRAIHDKKDAKMAKFWNGLMGGRAWNIMKSVFGEKKSIPTATLVLTQDDIYRLKNEFGIDLRSKPTVRSLFRNLLLFNLVIVDDSTGEVEMWDTDDLEFVTYKIDYIKKDNDKSNDVVKSILDYSNRR